MTIRLRSDSGRLIGIAKDNKWGESKVVGIHGFREFLQDKQFGVSRQVQ
jgi:hypothetical protein